MLQIITVPSAATGRPASSTSSAAVAAQLEQVAQGLPWEVRVAYATRHGQAAARVLRGVPADYPVSLDLLLKSRFYVLLRDKHGHSHAEHYTLFSRWGDVKPLVEDCVLEGSRRRWELGELAIFQAWPSKREAAAYGRGAGF